VSPLHADALTTLRDWAAPTTDQALLRDRYVALLESRPDAMMRECLPDHLTASTLVLDEDHSRVLLTHHAKARRWFQFGGHPEAEDTTLAGAALREAVEESGLHASDLTLDAVPVELDAHLVPFCAPGTAVHHFDVMFVAVARNGARHGVSEESLDVAWWPIGELPNPDLATRIAPALARLGQSESASS
jgi:8-oxo-dGTP pyrophosphatase MutT (NUDIX family)